MRINPKLFSSVLYNTDENCTIQKMVIFSFVCNFSKFLEEFISCGTEVESNPTRMAALNQKVLPLIRLLERK